MFVLTFFGPAIKQLSMHLHVDYWNSFYSLPGFILIHLQFVPNYAVCSLYCYTKFFLIPTILRSVHWFHIKFCTRFKIILIVYKVLKWPRPTYLILSSSPNQSSFVALSHFFFLLLFAYGWERLFNKLLFHYFSAVSF